MTCEGFSSASSPSTPIGLFLITCKIAVFKSRISLVDKGPEGLGGSGLGLADPDDLAGASKAASFDGRRGEIDTGSGEKFIDKVFYMWELPK